MKKCKACNVEKPLEEFQKHKQMADGHLNQCKICRSAYEKAHKSANKDKTRAYGKTYYETHKEQASVRAKQRYQESKDYKKQKQREYYKENTAKVKSYQKQYHETHKKDALYSATRRNNKHIRRTKEKEQCDNTVTAQALEVLKASQEGKCKYCKTTLNFADTGTVHLDHIVPISRGGFHSITNVCWSCSSCNLSKGAKLLEEWISDE